jgi:hypothetical protein
MLYGLAGEQGMSNQGISNATGRDHEAIRKIYNHQVRCRSTDRGKRKPMNSIRSSRI